MFIPKEALEIAEIAPKNDPHQSVKSVQIERRPDGRPTMTATCGKKLISVRWKESSKVADLPDSLNLPDSAIDWDNPAGGFQAMIPADELKRIKPTIKKSHYSTLSNEALLLEENVTGTAQFIAGDVFSPTRTEARTCSSDPVKWRSCLPESDGSDCIRVTVDAQLAFELFRSLARMTKGQNHQPITLHINPSDLSWPIVMTNDTHDMNITAMLMPCVAKDGVLPEYRKAGMDSDREFPDVD